MLFTDWVDYSGTADYSVWASDDTWGSRSYRWGSPSWPLPCSAPCAPLNCIVCSAEWTICSFCSGQCAVWYAAHCVEVHQCSSTVLKSGEEWCSESIGRSGRPLWLWIDLVWPQVSPRSSSSKSMIQIQSSILIPILKDNPMMRTIWRGYAIGRILDPRSYICFHTFSIKDP